MRVPHGRSRLASSRVGLLIVRLERPQRAALSREIQLQSRTIRFRRSPVRDKTRLHCFHTRRYDEFYSRGFR